MPGGAPAAGLLPGMVQRTGHAPARGPPLLALREPSPPSLQLRGPAAQRAHLCALLLQRLPKAVHALQVNVGADVAALGPGSARGRGTSWLRRMVVWGWCGSWGLGDKWGRSRPKQTQAFRHSREEQRKSGCAAWPLLRPLTGEGLSACSPAAAVQ